MFNVLIKLLVLEMPLPDPIWEYFNQLGHVTGYKQKRRQCKKCGQQINNSLKSARVHLRKCSKITLAQKKNYFKNSNDESDCDTSLSTSVSTPLSACADYISKEEQKSLELAFAKSVFRCGLFLSLSEMEPIKELWQQAKPEFKLPSRRKLSTKLLDYVFNETKCDVESLINKSTNMCLISDGWSNLVQEHWTNYILTTPKPVFFTAHPTGEIRQNAETIANDLEKIIIEVGPSKISALITDNASVMKKAWKLLELKYPNIFFLGCVAHSLNLLIGDIMKVPWSANILKRAKEIVLYFRSHQIPMAILRRHQLATYKHRRSLKLPAKTRWGSSATCLNSVLQNQLALKLTITEITHNNHEKLPDLINNTVMDEAFWKEIESLLLILDKLVAGISLFESDTPHLALFYLWYYEQLESDGKY